MPLNKKDIADMKAALALLTRQELELLCLDRAIRADGLGIVLTPEQLEQLKNELNRVPVSAVDMYEMNRIVEFVGSQVDLE